MIREKCPYNISGQSGPDVIKHFSCSAKLSMEHLFFYEQFKFHPEL